MIDNKKLVPLYLREYTVCKRIARRSENDECFLPCDTRSHSASPFIFCISLFNANIDFSSLATCDFAGAEDRYLRKNIITITKIIYIMAFPEKAPWSIFIVMTPRVSIS